MNTFRTRHLATIRAAVAAVLVLTLPEVAADDLDIDARLKRLSDQVQAQAAEIRSLHIELEKSREAEKMSDVSTSQDALAEETFDDRKILAPAKKTNQVFFRGGYAQGSSVGTLSLVNRLEEPEHRSKGHQSSDVDGFYVGASLDHQLTGDLWGLWPRVSLGAEFMVEYVESQRTFSNEEPASEVQTNQLMVTASPKAKLNGFGRFEPWVIPFGLVISVFDDQNDFLFGSSTKISPGVMVGTGLDYRVWQDIYAGIDFRYVWQFASSRHNNTLYDFQWDDRLDGFQTGAYFGVRF